MHLLLIKNSRPVLDKYRFLMNINRSLRRVIGLCGILLGALFSNTLLAEECDSDITTNKFYDLVELEKNTNQLFKKNSANSVDQPNWTTLRRFGCHIDYLEKGPDNQHRLRFTIDVKTTSIVRAEYKGETFPVQCLDKKLSMEQLNINAELILKEELAQYSTFGEIAIGVELKNCVYNYYIVPKGKHEGGWFQFDMYGQLIKYLNKAANITYFEAKDLTKAFVEEDP